jgi:murein DD-endopeptidase MepM/ murein hydrolase activator NlpD
MHLDTTLAKQGDIIKGGTVIGTSGNTGEFASGQYHLHFSIYPSSIAPKLGTDKKWDVRQSVNPMNYLPK